MTTEGILALCSLAGVFATIAAGVYKGGQMAQRLDQGERDRVRLEALIEDTRRSASSQADKIEAKLDRIWEWLHENVTRSQDSKPPR